MWRGTLVVNGLTRMYFRLIAETYSEPIQTSEIGLFAEIVNGSNPLTIFTKSPIFDVWMGSEYISAFNRVFLLSIVLIIENCKLCFWHALYVYRVKLYPEIVCLNCFWLNGWVFTDELNGCRFESRCSLLKIVELQGANCVCVKRITLCNCLCSSSSCFSASLIRNIGEFGAKTYFTHHRTANTIHGFRDSFRVLKIHGCY